MPRRSSFLTTAATLALFLAAAQPATAGPLDPPAGPVTPTPGPEPRIAVNAANTPGDADALFKITQPGSYYLQGNITGVVGKHGIEINADGVTLDLNGFELLGVAGMGAFDGVSVTEHDGLAITVRNGSVRNWGDCGVEFDYLSGNPPRGTVSGIVATDNARHGIATYWGATVEHCTALENGDDGIHTVGDGTVISCLANDNDGDGIDVNSGSLVTACVASSNTGAGFALSLGTTAVACTAYNNDNGFTGQGCVITNSTSHRNSSHGFMLFEGNTVTGSSAYRNAGAGFFASGSNTIAQCIATANDLEGIRVSSNSFVRDNQCNGNGAGTAGGANILVAGSDNRIQGNNCTDADRGIDIDSAGNYIVGNTCSGNTVNWTAVTGNVCLVVAATQTISVINGDSGGISPGSTNPFANFTY